MYPSLKSLYNRAKEEGLTRYFKHLEDYCRRADELHPGNKPYPYGYNSLKWFIHAIREFLPPDKVQQLFNRLIVQAKVYKGEESLYQDIMSFDVAQRYASQIEQHIQHVKAALDEMPVRKIGRWRVLINNTPFNITKLAFKEGIADIIVFRNPQNWGGVIFNEIDTSVLQYFDVDALLEALQQRGENFVKIGNNLVICGGPKHPENKTTITTDELFDLVKSIKSR